MKTMRPNLKAIESYGDVKVTTGVSNANSIELIQMLFDGLLESLSAARGHIQHGAIADKSKALGRASRIVLGLQGALDFNQGGDLASNLNELYSYVTKRIFHINVRNDLEALDEIYGLMSEIREAWNEVPALVPASSKSPRSLN
jgi:flagellar protein FliS